MLAQMPRQFLQPHAQRMELPDTWMPHIQSSLAEICCQCIFGILIPPRTDKLCQLVEQIKIESQNLSNLASRGFPVVSNDVGRHRGAKFSVTFVNILNCALAFSAAGQIQIDVRPLAAFFGKKSLEEEFFLYRIRFRNSQHITD